MKTLLKKDNLVIVALMKVAPELQMGEILLSRKINF